MGILAWQNTADAHGAFPKNRPKPIPRPNRGDKDDTVSAPMMGGMAASVMPVEEYQRRIEERRSRGA